MIELLSSVAARHADDEALACSLFWFNPFVWLTHQRLGVTREAACDELVADSASHARAYVGALAKFCGALIAPRVPGVSCVASGHFAERTRHLMSYPAARATCCPIGRSF